MGRTVIVSEETIRSLLQANAALAAWYHEFLRASREQTPVMTPADGARQAFLDRLGQEFPELQQLVRAIGVPPVYVPPPIAFAPTAGPMTPGPSGGNPQPPGVVPGAAGAPSAMPAQPPMVNPRLVKY